jgi:hypothetical protein
MDWASQKHAVVVVDPKGKKLEEFEIDHSALGWKKFRERMKTYGLDHFRHRNQPRCGRRLACSSIH